jgi:hypothetical protein
MDKLVYGLCALTAASCAVLLLRSFMRTRFRLLLWSGLCFVGLTLNNMLLIADRFVFTSIDLLPWRLLVALVSVLLLLGALILEDSK